jgi:hypothetical protein
MARNEAPASRQKQPAKQLLPTPVDTALRFYSTSPLPSVARFGRLVYPMRGEVTNRDMLGGKRHSCPVHKMHCGGNDLGGSKPGGLKINE